MRKSFTLFFLSLMSLSLAQNNNTTNGVEMDDKGLNVADIVKFSGTWFIAFRDGISQVQADDDHKATTEQNSFVLKRSYFTLKKDLNDVFSVRYTMDLTIDNEGDDAGNVETRLKYLYLKAKPKLNSDVFTGTWIEAGMVHTPWLDYEQKINTYRVQDNMFIERNRIFNSADFGVTVGGNIGGDMDKEFLKEVNGAMPGKWFTYVLGLYNGGGYSSKELNKNKVFSVRVSVRPLANTLPELHWSGYYNIGKGNSENSPHFEQLLSMLAYTGKNYTFTGQYHQGRGDFRARYIDENNPSEAFKNSGYSFFGEYRIHKSPFSIWGRYDSFTLDKISKKEKTERIIAGVTYRLNKNLRLILNTEQNKQNKERNQIYELNLEVSF